jgi:hypothetical protein
MRDVFILNKVWAQHKTYFFRHFTWMTYFTHHLVLVPNHNQHIFLLAKLRKVCYSLHELNVKSVDLNLFGWSGCEVHETSQGGCEL